jgi:hypothetical protein
MPLKEQPSVLPKESWPAGLPKYEDVQAREKFTLKKLGNTLGDVARDIDTANKMAGDKFEGDSALMRTARGFVTTGIGVGLEKSMNFVWDKVWQGDIPFYDKSKFGTGMAEAMNKFAGSSDFNARMYYLIKEGTQDLSLAIFYNFLAFRSQPLLPKAEPKHLLRALTADAIEAFATPISPKLPGVVQLEAKLGTNSIIEAQINDLDEKIASYAGRSHYDKAHDQQVFPMSELAEKLKQRKAALEGQVQQLDIPERQGKVEEFIYKAVDVSNPVTMLGIDMIGSGITSLVRNFREVRKMRKEKGGMEGKKVPVPKKEGWKDRGGDRKPFEKRDYNKDKVYYGKSAWKDQQKLQEEYDLKADDT